MILMNDKSIFISLVGKEGLSVGRQGKGRFFDEIILKIPLFQGRDI